MTLDMALSVLATSHTRDDDFSGFVIEGNRQRMHWPDHEYVEAWKVVRQHLRMQVNPQSGSKRGSSLSIW